MWFATLLAMSRTITNFLLDGVLLALTVAIFATSCVVRFVFPPGTAAKGWTIWGQNYDAWAALQFNLMALAVLSILLHVMMHWNWVCGVFATRLFRRKPRPDDGTQTLYGVIVLMGLLLLLGGFVLTARIGLVPPVG